MSIDLLRRGLAPLTSDDAVKRLLEPCNSVSLGDLVLLADTGRLVLAAVDTATGAGEAHVEVHTVDTGGRIVLDAQVNVLLNTETEVAWPHMMFNTRWHKAPAKCTQTVSDHAGQESERGGGGRD